MNGNGQLLVGGIFLLTTVVIVMFAVGVFDLPGNEPEAKPIELLAIEADEALVSRAPIELILQYTGDTEQGLAPDQIYHGVTAQALAQTQAVDLTKIQAHTGACSRGY